MEKLDTESMFCAVFNGITDEKYCVRCGKRLSSVEQEFFGNLCSECNHEWEKIEKE